MAQLLLIDAEPAGGVGEWGYGVSGGSNTFAGTSAHPLHGSYSFALTYTGSLENWKRQDFTVSTDTYVRFYFHIDVLGLTVNDTYTAQFIMADASDNTWVYVRFYKNASGIGYMVKQYDNARAETVVKDASTLGIFQVGESHYMELRLVEGASSDGGVQVWVDGSQTGSVLTKTNTNANISRIHMGAEGGTTLANGALWYWDDIEVGTAYIGPIVAGGSAIPAMMANYRRMRNN
jgi:hypothetical protein